MLTDEQLMALEEYYRSGDAHAAMLLCLPGLPAGDSVTDHATRSRYWQELRSTQAAKEYLSFLKEDAFSAGGVPLGEHTNDLRGDILEIKEDLTRMRRGLGQMQGAPNAIPSLHGMLLKAREMQAKASGLYSRREDQDLNDDAAGDGAKVRGVKIEWC